MITPLDFQTEKARELREEISKALKYGEERIIPFTAPTGSGKTLITKLAIEPILADAAWIWLSYQPSLNRQSMDKLNSYGIPWTNLEELSAEAGISHLERAVNGNRKYIKISLPSKNGEPNWDGITKFIQSCKFSSTI